MRIRVELDDVPGALGRVCNELAALECSIGNVDVHSVDGNVVVDHFLVEVPEGVQRSALTEAVLAAGARPVVADVVDRHVIDPQVACMDLAAHIARVTDPLAFRRAVEASLMRLVHSDAAWYLRVPSPPRHGPIGRAIVRRDVVVERGYLLPRPVRGTAGGPPWQAVVPNLEGPVPVVAYLARAANVPYTATEIARIQALMRCTRAIEAVRGMSPPAPAPPPLLSDS